MNTLIIENNLKENQSLSIGIYNKDKQFTGCFWDSHEQTNEWIINDINITDRLCEDSFDFVEDDYQNIFKLCFDLTNNKLTGKELLKSIINTFNQHYISDEGIITEK